MKQGLIEKISKNKELPKNMLDVYRYLGYMNYKFGCSNYHINDYTNICLITKSLNGLDFSFEVNENIELFYPYFRWDDSYGRFVFCSVYRNKEYYYGNFTFGFRTKELAEYAGKTFINQYNKWLIISENELKLIEEVDCQEIKTMSDVYRVNGITKLTTPPETKERYYEDLILVAKALNGNWKPDWNDMNENKWFPYFNYFSALRFSYTNAICTFELTGSDIGSRLCFKNEQIAEYAGKTFIEQYEKIMNF